MIKTIYIALAAAAIGVFAAPGKPCVPIHKSGKLQLEYRVPKKVLDYVAIKKGNGLLSKVDKTSQTWQFYQCNGHTSANGKTGEVRSAKDASMCLTAVRPNEIVKEATWANYTLSRCVTTAGTPVRDQLFGLGDDGRVQGAGPARGENWLETFYHNNLGDDEVVGVEPYKGMYEDAYLYLR